MLGEIVQVETRLILPAAAWLEAALAIEVARLIGRSAASGAGLPSR